jgi:hypothetical protein
MGPCISCYEYPLPAVTPYIISLAHATTDVVLKDVAPSRFTLAVQESLGSSYPLRWIDYRPEARVLWPPRSPNRIRLTFTCGVP